MRNENYKWSLLFMAVLILVGSVFDYLDHADKREHEERLEKIKHGQLDAGAP